MRGIMKALCMEQRTVDGLSPYRTFTRAEWASLREDTPMRLTPAEALPLRSILAGRQFQSGLDEKVSRRRD